MSKHVAIILAAGKGSRMNADIPKQYLEIEGKTAIEYTLKVFQESFIDEIIAVVGEGEVDYFRDKIVIPSGFDKVVNIVVGGKERYNSVYNGLVAIGDCDYVYIHDGARCCITNEVLERGRDDAIINKASIAAVPVKDTIKVISSNSEVESTPNRNSLWQIQTPQIFAFKEIKDAYDKMLASNDSDITDDSMVMERYGKLPVHVFMGDYNNIKMTTKEDLIFLKNILKKC